jgi:hypothetical protein
MNLTNAFGKVIRCPLEILNDKAIRPQIDSALLELFHLLTRDKHVAAEACDSFSALIPNCSTEEALEKKGYEFLARNFGLMDRISARLKERSNKIIEQVSRWHPKGRLLDFGCGDGAIGAAFTSKCDVTLYDVVDYKDPNVNLPLVIGRESEQILAGEEYDTILLLTVLHHSIDPIGTLREVRRLCSGRVIVIESVFGLKIRSQGWDPHTAAYFELSEDKQRDFNTYFDWFYNRVLHQNVPVPFNFNQPNGWIKVFRRCGFEVLGLEHLGIDQPLVPEYHILYWLG